MRTRGNESSRQYVHPPTFPTLFKFIDTLPQRLFPTHTSLEDFWAKTKEYQSQAGWPLDPSILKYSPSVRGFQSD